MSKLAIIPCLMGPTASGKTALAIELAKRFHFDIISVDSGMIYRGMDIGTAKPTLEEQAIAPHRLIDIRDPLEVYSAKQFCCDALHEIELILQSGRIPLLVGGTMLYFRALQQGLSDLPEANSDIRARLSREMKEKGLDSLHARLVKIDSIAASRIRPTDSQRIQRALEVYEITGKTLTELFARKPIKCAPYTWLNMALIPSDRDLLYQRVRKRFEHMLTAGFVEEVKKLYERGDLHLGLPSIRVVGYRHVWRYLTGELVKEQMVDQAIIATRQLAKRQLTWLKNWPCLHSFEMSSEGLFEKILAQLVLCGLVN